VDDRTCIRALSSRVEGAEWDDNLEHSERTSDEFMRGVDSGLRARGGSNPAGLTPRTR